MVTAYRQPRRANLSIQQRLKQIGLLGYWNLSGGDGTPELNRFPDVSLFDMSVTGTVTSAAGPSNSIPLARASGGGANYLGTADNVYIPSGACQFTVAGWIFMTSKAATRPLMAHNQATGNLRSWTVEYNSGADRFAVTCSQDGTTGALSSATDSSLGSPSTNTWYFLVGGFNGARSFIQVNALPRIFSASAITSLFDSTETMRIMHDGTTGLVGRASQVGLWNRVLSQEEVFWLYNNGQGRSLVRGV